MADAQMRDRYVAGLLERVREEPYPSSNQMNLVESLLPVHEMDTYLEILLEKVEDDRFPSVELLARIQRLVAQLPRAADRDTRNERSLRAG
jgi:hypothetical protein